MNPFYQSFQQQNQNGGLPRNFQEAASSIIAQLNARHMTPEQRVRQMLQNKEMTQEQFEQLSRMADQITGRRH